MHYMTVVALGFRWCYKNCQQKHILAWGSNSSYLGEIWQLGSPWLPVWSVVAANKMNICMTKLSNMNCFCNLKIVIPRLHCLRNVANAVMSALVIVNSDTSDSLRLCNFRMCASASKCFPMELVPCSNRYRKTWWPMIHMKARMLISSFPRCK